MHFYGLFGEHLSHSLSPLLHRSIYQKTGLQASYKTFAFPPAELSEAVASIRTLTISGVNVTIPYKETVLPFLDELDPLARQLQAVNTIKNQAGHLIGYNTDYAGFGLIFERRKWSPAGKTAVVLGTGGAAKMVIAYLLHQGIQHINIVSRSPERFESTDKTTYTNYTSASTLQGDFLINTTPVGMHPNTADSPVSEGMIQQFGILIDLVYNPFETTFLSLGRKHAKETANGLDMLIGQAVRAVEIWENIEIDSSIIEELIQEFGERR
ncbi:shikimate dehydrogenase [Marinilactibacillus piezotolerans]|uniref:shikimate dehydrogenase n=1 Tax=Marinilactibacillus piezotolerans TaxID=258723 RepID=UPI0009B0B6D8|nr:shikimate dehydrogenase [Marinilactibacillus piezotolerans]